MDVFFPSLVGAAIPVLLGLLAVARQFGKMEANVGQLQSMVGVIQIRLDSLDTDNREIAKMQHEETQHLFERIHSAEMTIVDRVSRIEGLISAPRRD